MSYFVYALCYSVLFFLYLVTVFFYLLDNCIFSLFLPSLPSFSRICRRERSHFPSNSSGISCVSFPSFRNQLIQFFYILSYCIFSSLPYSWFNFLIFQKYHVIFYVMYHSISFLFSFTNRLSLLLIHFFPIPHFVQINFFLFYKLLRFSLYYLKFYIFILSAVVRSRHFKQLSYCNFSLFRYS